MAASPRHSGTGRDVRRPLYRVLTVALLTGLVAASAPTAQARCETLRTRRPARRVAAPYPAVAPSGRPSDGRAGAPTADCPYPKSGFHCAQQRRLAASERYLAGRPGVTAIVVRDRDSGAVWRNAHTRRPIWTASTIKLAIALDLLERNRAGQIRLLPADRASLNAMLRDSDDAAATRLWERFDGPAAQRRYAAYGLLGLRFPGRVYWGSAQSTAEDFDRLMTHVLEKSAPEIRAYLVEQLRAVAPNQRWGVWGAGPTARPGNKNGWFQYGNGWVINSVGFVGPDERYTVTLLNDLGGEGGYAHGVETTTRVAELLFAGRF